MKRRRKALIVLVLAGASLLIYAMIVIVLEICAPTQMDEWFRPRAATTFSKVEWKKTQFGDPQRYEMANGLLQSRQLIGATENDARAILGQPNSRETINGEIKLNYELVPQRMFPAKCFFLPSNLFFNTETWLLEVCCEGGMVRTLRIRQT